VPEEDSQMSKPVCFTCRMRDQMVRLGERRASVSGPHELADPWCDKTTVVQVELPGRANRRGELLLIWAAER
jgi:hypothetical protein